MHYVPIKSKPLLFEFVKMPFKFKTFKHIIAQKLHHEANRNSAYPVGPPPLPTTLPKLPLQPSNPQYRPTPLTTSTPQNSVNFLAAYPQPQIFVPKIIAGAPQTHPENLEKIVPTLQADKHTQAETQTHVPPYIYRYRPTICSQLKTDNRIRRQYT